MLRPLSERHEDPPRDPPLPASCDRQTQSLRLAAPHRHYLGFSRVCGLTGIKVLDALAAGAPVVTTSFGNEGIGAIPGRDLLVADDPRVYADAVLAILRDERVAARLREFVRNFSLEVVLTKIESAYWEIAGGDKQNFWYAD